MSCYNWEQGSVKIPVASWSTIKRAVKEAYNAYQERRYNSALSLYNGVVAAGKAKRNFDFKAAERSQATANYDYCWLKYNDAGKPLKPKKKDYPKATSTSTLFSYGEVEIGFDNKTRCIEWRVDENNRAVEHAHSHPVSKAFFKALKEITWTTKTGGVFVGNDEYNRDNMGSGGGGNYVTSSYGGIGKREVGFQDKRRY